MTTRLTERLRLEPIGPRHGADLLALFRDPAVAEWYGEWTPDEAARETEPGSRGGPFALYGTETRDERQVTVR
ncbi:MAG: hypothetical protein ABW022_15795 [Actinoplanes sp.]